MLTIIGHIWTLAILFFGLGGFFVIGFILGIEYTQMEEDEYENGSFMDKAFMRMGQKIVNFWM